MGGYSGKPILYFLYFFVCDIFQKSEVECAPTASEIDMSYATRCLECRDETLPKGKTKVPIIAVFPRWLEWSVKVA